MTRILKEYEKKPGEVQDYDLNFNAYLTYLSDTILTATVQADTGITIDSSVVTDGILKIWTSGGSNMVDYLVRGIVTTVGGRTHYGIIKIKVRD